MQAHVAARCWVVTRDYISRVLHSPAIFSGQKLRESVKPSPNTHFPMLRGPFQFQSPTPLPSRFAVVLLADWCGVLQASRLVSQVLRWLEFIFITIFIFLETSLVPIFCAPNIKYDIRYLLEASCFVFPSAFLTYKNISYVGQVDFSSTLKGVIVKLKQTEESKCLK